MRQHKAACKSLREICRILDASGIKPKRGKSWRAASVMKILKLTERLECDNKYG
ncbi:MAG: recombinase family protein [Proteobacteria bacterium]|nr:recombinase family protein [Pseudomonadota bacterium]